MKDIILISALENAIINWHSKTKKHEFENQDDYRPDFFIVA